MKVVIGLGNPEKAYENTRHNIGFKVVDELARKHEIDFKRKRKYLSLIAEENIFYNKVWLVKPLTYMNLSGKAVLSILKNNNLSLEDMLVVSDDINLEVGKIRIRKQGTSGGHQGLNSIIECIEGSLGFPRLRIGVGRNEDIPAEKYVLGKFTPKEKKNIDTAIKEAVQAIELILKKGLEPAMSKHN